MFLYNINLLIRGTLRFTLCLIQYICHLNNMLHTDAANIKNNSCLHVTGRGLFAGLNHKA